jgi:hypothetical protein
MKNNNAMEYLVNSQNGIYAWDVLLNNFKVYVNDNKPHELKNWLMNNSDKMDGETIKTLFHPDNEHYCENIEFLNCGAYYLSIIDKQGIHWTIDQIDGDIWAIHPMAKWDEDKETYTIGDTK